MWDKIHNNLTSSTHKKLIESVKKTFDYEEFYEEVISNNNYTEETKDACRESIIKTYKEMDKNIYANYKSELRGENRICLNKLRKFLSLFGRTNDGDTNFSSSAEPGFFFTINQDLFVERFCAPIVQPGIPFLDCNRLCHNGFSIPDNLKTEEIPTKEQLNKIKQEKWGKELYYIKLHGSYEWRKQDALVIGTKKMDRIKAEPILEWYYQLFKGVLSSGGRRLVVIGYGFRDKHINDVIVDSITNSGLKINIVCPNDAEKFKRDTLEKHTKKDEADIIWKAIDNYLKKFFPFSPSLQDYNKLCDYLKN